MSQRQKEPLAYVPENEYSRSGLARRSDFWTFGEGVKSFFSPWREILRKMQ
jgi:hypothetical protein